MTEKAKEKKVTKREILRAELAILLKTAKGLEAISRTKEGLVITDGETDLIVRVIEKKDRIKKVDVVEVL